MIILSFFWIRRSSRKCHAITFLSCKMSKNNVQFCYYDVIFMALKCKRHFVCKFTQNTHFLGWGFIVGRDSKKSPRAQKSRVKNEWQPIAQRPYYEAMNKAKTIGSFSLTTSAIRTCIEHWWSAVSMNNRYFGLLQEYSWLVIDTSLDNFAGGRSARENANYLPDRLAEANC